MNWIIIMALTISSSIDNLGVGLSYGIRKLEIGVIKNFVIAVICFLFSMAGISFGVWIATILPGSLPLVVGAFLLVIIGVRIMLLAKPNNQTTVNESSESEKKKEKGIFKNIESSVRKQSGEIGWGESIVLGIALSANALTNGVGAGLLGLSPLIISALAGIGSFVTVWFGVRLGSRLADVRIGSFTIGQFGTFISGALILVVAVMVFF